jgi:hypothetical protein
MRRMPYFFASAFSLILLAFVIPLSEPLSAEEVSPSSTSSKVTFTLHEAIFGNEVNETTNSCSIDCGDGRQYDTDAPDPISCACDCAVACGGTCEVTDGTETRTCTEA